MNKVDSRRVIVYLLIAFGFSWSVALVIYLTGGISGSQSISPGSPVKWSFLLLVLYMAGPALGNIGARLITREGRSDLWLRPQFRRGWKYWLIAWFLTPFMVIAGGVFYFLFNPQAFNVGALAGEGIPGLEAADAPVQLLLVANIIVAILISPLANAIATFGEEFGWRGYLQPKLLPLGERRMYLLVGLIWGAWHWPVIWMGYNYPDYPLLGSLAMVWFTFVTGTFFGWAALRAGSVWPAVIGHGALNGIAQLWFLFLAVETNPLLGPGVVGIFGGIFFSAAALLIIWKAKN